MQYSFAPLFTIKQKSATRIIDLLGTKGIWQTLDCVFNANSSKDSLDVIFASKYASEKNSNHT